MENALFVTTIEDLGRYAAGGTYDRLYFGVEFCQRLLPSPEDLSVALSFAGGRRLPLTLVTPFVTDDGLAVVLRLLEQLAAAGQPGTEAVINDWGVLRAARHAVAGKPELVLGRLLTKQKRDPRIAALNEQLPVDAAAHLAASSVDSSLVAAFLGEQGIGRVELDNVAQGIRRYGTMRASLYYPYCAITTTRFCPMSGSEERKRNLRAIEPCRRECRSYRMSLTTKRFPKEILLKGNTQFYINERLPENLDQLHIDRTVYQPVPPV